MTHLRFAISWAHTLSRSTVTHSEPGRGATCSRGLRSEKTAGCRCPTKMSHCISFLPITYPPKCLSLLGIPQGSAGEKGSFLLFSAFNDIQAYPVTYALFLEAGEGEGGGKGENENKEVARRGGGTDTKMRDGERQRERQRYKDRDKERDEERQKQTHRQRQAAERLRG